jgi:hypothetical protein
VSLVALCAGVSGAQPLGSGDVLQSCVLRGTGALRLVQDANYCRKNEQPLAWSRLGREGAPGIPGPRGPVGPPGPVGPAGVSSSAFHTQAIDSVTVPGSYGSVMQLQLPAGSYLVNATILLSNLGRTRAAVLCSGMGPGGSFVISGTQLEVDQPGLEDGASMATLPVSFPAILAAPGRIDLECGANMGASASTKVIATHRQMTAVRVASVTLR